MFVGIDIGTQSLKAVVCDSALAVRGSAATSYEPVFPRPGWAEQDPACWERALAPTIADALAAAAVAPDQVVALGIAGQLDGCIACDADGAALAPALIWMDRRATAEIEGIDPELVLERAGVVLDASHMAAKIRWLQRKGPAEAVRYHQPVSYLVARLTGVHCLDHAQASTTMLYSLEQKTYDRTLLDLFEIAEALLPTPAAADRQAGSLTQAGAALTGLPAGLPVAVGTGDDFSNPLGAGLAAPGRVACALGTAEVVGALSDRPVIDRDALVETHAYGGGLYFVENPGWLSGGALTWFVKAHRLADAVELDALAAAAPPGAAGLSFLPALSGAMAPEWIAAARAGYYGLSASHETGHMARAVLEGCAFAMRDVVERLRALAVPTESLLLLGGGAKSLLWAQIRADATGLAAEVPQHQDSSPIGAALLAAVAVEAWPDLASAARQLGQAAEWVEPDPELRGAYDEAYGRYRELFECLRPLYR